MAKMWRRRLREDDEEDDDDDEEEVNEGRYRRPKIEARHYDPEIIENLSFFDDDDEDSSHVDELLDRVREGKYRPKRSDHWSVHVAYNLMKNREK